MAGMHELLLLRGPIHTIQTDADRRIKSAWEKSLDSGNFFSEFFFPNFILLCSFFGAVEWIGRAVARCTVRLAAALPITRYNL